MTTTTAKILKLQTANVKRISVVEIEPTGALVTISGRNGQGKSSVLDSIEYALGGAGAIPSEPIRHGQRKAKTVVTLDNGIVVTRTYQRGGQSRLEVTRDGETLKSPQAILDALTGKLTFDPLEYARMKPPAQAETLRKLVGLDTAALDAERKATFDQRTESNREVKRLQGALAMAPKHTDAPKEEVSVAALNDELDKRRAVADANRAARARVEALCETAKSAERLLGDVDRKIVEAERHLAQLREEQAQAKERAAKLHADHAAAAKASVSLADPDLEEIRVQLRTAEETNRKVRENAARAKLERQLEEAEVVSEKLTDQIKAVDEMKAALLADAKFPVPGLGFDDVGVTLDGVPLEQASQAQRIRLSVAIGFALNPRLKILLVRDGSALDRESLEMVRDLATAAGGQVWLEQVSEDGHGCSVFIEDGAVKQLEAAE